MHTQEQTNPMKGLGDMSDWLPRAPIKNGAPWNGSYSSR